MNISGVEGDYRVTVIVPAYNEAAKIAATLAGIPPLVSRIYVVNDASSDRTAEIVRECASRDPRISLIDLAENSGVGAAIVAGYLRVLNEKSDSEDIAVVMAGDGQMNPLDLPAILKPIVRGQADYVKGNRFIAGRSGIDKIPRHRLFGNLVLSALTKIASGYWHVSDSQSGYTAINRRALSSVDWTKCYPRYGCPNDYLVRLNIANMRVADVPIDAVYGPEWRSHMKPFRVMFPLLVLLLKLFLERMFRKYVVANGHPIVFFYLVSFLAFSVSSLLFTYVATRTLVYGVIPQTATILWGVSGIVSVQLLLQCFEMDYRDNEWLFVHERN